MARPRFPCAWLLVGLTAGACSAQDFSYLQRDLNRPIDAGAGGSNGGESATGGANDGGGATGGASSVGCAGVASSAVCWYLGELGASCETTCAPHGGTSPKAPSHVGIVSQGGSLGECQRLLGLFGMTGTVIEASRSDGQGVGCHMIPGDPDAYFWLSSPEYSDTASLSNARIACGCAH
jgi:hypothetical protein